MCWIGRFNPKENIAEEDIPIFKICDSSFTNIVRSYYFKSCYKLGDVYYHCKLRLEESPSGVNTIIQEGFHSYSSDKLIAYRIADDTCGVTFKVNPSFNVGVYAAPCSVVTGVIPKGAIYFINNCGEIVSDAIKLDKTTVIFT